MSRFFHFRCFSFLSILLLLTVVIALPHAAAPSAVTTFESIGLYWSPANGAETAPCSVRYREAGASAWKNGLPLWYDLRSSATVPGFPRSAPEYRGSIVGLKPGTTHEIKLTLSNGTTETVSAKTWSEDPPIASAVCQPELSASALTVTRSGTAAGYIVYKPLPGKTATIDVDSGRTACVYVNASYIVLRRLFLKNGKNHCIELGPNAHHVVIEWCDMSGWGVILNDGWGQEHDAAVYGTSLQNTNIVVQRCRIHHPRGDANNWSEKRPNYGPAANGHPQGPQAIELTNSNGNNVFRCNDIYSDMDHMFNDGIGGYHNGSYQGFPGPDSDVYGNIIMNCWDNPLEMEGGGMNVRVWGNYTDFSYTGIATIPVAVGPVYIFRNVCNKLFKDHAFDRSTRFFKSGGAGVLGDGRVYIFHNSMLQEYYKGKLMGGGCGIAGTGIITNYISRNNILFIFNQNGLSINDEKNKVTTGIKANSFDYDLYNGGIVSSDPDKEAHGIRAAPKWAPDTMNVYNPLKTGKARITLASGTAGVDAGARLDNFNDDFTGNGPDMGAGEGGKTMEFGVDAYSNPITQSGEPTAGRAYAGGRLLLSPDCLSGPVEVEVPRGNSTDITVAVVDVAGRTAYKRILDGSVLGRETPIDVSRLKRGVYIVRIGTRDGARVTKFIR